MLSSRFISKFIRRGEFFSQYKHEYKKNHKPKTSCIDKYEALPEYRTVQRADPFDYKLSSRNEVNEHILENMIAVPLRITLKQSEADVGIFNDYTRKVKLTTNSKYFKLSILQKERLKFLMLTNYNEKTGEMKFTCDSFKYKTENTVKCVEMLKEVVIESMRAPFS